MNTSESIYNVPPDWEPKYSISKRTGDFPGDPSGYIKGPLLGWLTPDGFVSPDKLPEEYRVEQIPDYSCQPTTDGYILEQEIYPASDYDALKAENERLKALIAQAPHDTWSACGQVSNNYGGPCICWKSQAGEGAQ